MSKSIKLSTTARVYIKVGCSPVKLGKRVPININPDKLLNDSNSGDAFSDDELGASQTPLLVQPVLVLFSLLGCGEFRFPIKILAFPFA